MSPIFLTYGVDPNAIAQCAPGGIVAAMGIPPPKHGQLVLIGAGGQCGALAQALSEMAPDMAERVSGIVLLAPVAPWAGRDRCTECHGCEPRYPPGESHPGYIVCKRCRDTAMVIQLGPLEPMREWFGRASSSACSRCGSIEIRPSTDDTISFECFQGHAVSRPVHVVATCYPEHGARGDALSCEDVVRDLTGKWPSRIPLDDGEVGVGGDGCLAVFSFASQAEHESNALTYAMSRISEI
jgi:hypothetical protein